MKKIMKLLESMDDFGNVTEDTDVADIAVTDIEDPDDIDDMNEDLLMEGPLSWLKDKVSNIKNSITNKANKKDIENALKLDKPTYRYYVLNSSTKKYESIKWEDYQKLSDVEKASALVIDSNWYVVRKGIENYIGKYERIDPSKVGDTEVKKVGKEQQIGNNIQDYIYVAKLKEDGDVIDPDNASLAGKSKGDEVKLSYGAYKQYSDDVELVQILDRKGNKYNPDQLAAKEKELGTGKPAKTPSDDPIRDEVESDGKIKLDLKNLRFFESKASAETDEGLTTEDFKAISDGTRKKYKYFKTSDGSVYPMSILYNNKKAVKELKLLEESLTESYDFVSLEDTLEGMLGNAEDDTIDRDVKKFEEIAKDLGLSDYKDVVAFVDADLEYDPTYIDEAKVTHDGSKITYEVNDIKFIGEMNNGNLWMYFKSEADGCAYLEFAKSYFNE